MKRARTGGVEALRRRPAPGPTPKLTVEQRARLPELLVKDAEAYDFLGDVWTTKRVAAVIRWTFGISDHLSPISAITPDGRLFTHVQAEALRGPSIVAFLRRHLRHVLGKLLVIWPVLGVGHSVTCALDGTMAASSLRPCPPATPRSHPRRT